MKKSLFLLCAFVLIVISFSCRSKTTEYSIAWSHYTGWEPWDYARQEGILKKWADKYKIKIKLDLINDYVGSINLYTEKKYWGCVMTNMDALTLPASGGVDSTVLIIGDFSNGNDGIVTKKEKSIKDLKGKKIKLVQFSVSHYLLSRALAMNNMQEKGMTLVNTSEADINTAFLADKSGIAVTWNPILMNVAKQKGVNKIFDSAKIPGEIIDLMVVRTDAPEALKKALTGAWYETMQIMANNNNNAKAIEYMAKKSGATVAEFTEQLKTTKMFYTAAEAASFAKDEQLKKTMEYVRSFSFKRGLFGKSATSKDFVGIQFPDGSIMGDNNNVKLRFDATYMQMAAEGKLK